MKVKALIAALEKLDPEASVRTTNGYGETVTVKKVTQLKNQKTGRGANIVSLGTDLVSTAYKF